MRPDERRRPSAFARRPHLPASPAVLSRFAGEEGDAAEPKRALARRAGGQRRGGRRAQRRGERLDRSPSGRVAAVDEPDHARRTGADDSLAVEIVALAAPVGESEQGRERRALPGRGEMADGLQARRPDVGSGGPFRGAAKGQRLIAQAMAVRQQKQGSGIDRVDRDRRGPSGARPSRRDQIERLFVEIDRVSRSLPGSVAITAASSAPSAMRASRRSVRSSTRWSGVCGSASIASGSANGSR